MSPACTLLSMASSCWDWTPCLPRQVIPLWKALGTNKQMARKVMTLLYMKLKLRPPKELIRLSERVQLTSLLVSRQPCLGIQGPYRMPGSPGLRVSPRRAKGSRC